jgi:hypothetical protein
VNVQVIVVRVVVHVISHVLRSLHGPRAGLHAERMCPTRDCPRPAATCPVSPVLGAVHKRLPTEGLGNVHHEGGLAGPPIDDQTTAPISHRSWASGAASGLDTAVPDTVLVAEMSDGSLLLQGWRDGPSVYLCPVDAAPLRRELAAAFVSAELTLRAEEG